MSCVPLVEQLFFSVAQYMMPLSPTNSYWFKKKKIVSLTTSRSHHVSTELGQELLKTKRVRIAEEVILEDESKPKKKKKKDGGK